MPLNDLGGSPPVPIHKSDNQIWGGWSGCRVLSQYFARGEQTIQIVDAPPFPTFSSSTLTESA